MKKVGPGEKFQKGAANVRLRNNNLRSLARFYALGVEGNMTPEKKRLLVLALNEAEALACETGVPELVLLTLAEEKVTVTREWLARQDQFRSRGFQWQLAA